MSTGPGHEGCEDRCDVELVHAEAVALARARTPDADALARAVEVAAMLSNPTRLRIAAALAGEREAPGLRLCVCDLAAVVGASETATSHQLRALRLTGMVEQERAGRLVYYRLAREPRVEATVAALLQGAR